MDTINPFSQFLIWFEGELDSKNKTFILNSLSTSFAVYTLDSTSAIQIFCIGTPERLQEKNYTALN